MALFNSIKALRPKRNFFNLSHEYKFTCDMGKLIPVYLEECYPGDRFKISNECIVRMQPLSAPVMHNINVYTEYFFVPMRLLWEDWIDFSTGGKDGTASPNIPLWTTYLDTAHTGAKLPPLHSLWDYFCLPLQSPGSFEECPISLPRTAYNLIWNEYYRDENVMQEIGLDNDTILYRCWKKDYFTSALPFQQRGVSPSFPITGSAPVFGSAPVSYGVGYDVTGQGRFGFSQLSGFVHRDILDTKYAGVEAAKISNPLLDDISFSKVSTQIYDSVENTGTAYDHRVTASTSDTSNTLKASLNGIPTFNISDLRLAFQIQRWLERNARSGVRYPEFLMAHFGVSPSDARLQRPEYLGGTKSPLIVSEVLQTSESTQSSPQGNLAGRGLGASSGYICSYSVPEPGYIIGLFSIMPKPAYQSQGINKKWLRRSRYDFYSPEFAHLSEQPVKKIELFLSDDEETNAATFGFQGIYDELRHSRDKVSSYFRSEASPSLDYWHLARAFSASPALNADFLKCNPSKRIFEVQDEDGFLVDFANVIKAVRPLPKYAEPGLIDHF